MRFHCNLLNNQALNNITISMMAVDLRFHIVIYSIQDCLWWSILNTVLELLEIYYAVLKQIL